MAKVYVFLADGFEDVEALIPVDVLRRGGVEVVTVSVMDDNQIVESAHGVQMVADALIEDNGIIFWGKQGDLWLVVKHVFRHFIAFYRLDIRWIAHDEVPRWE